MKENTRAKIIKDFKEDLIKYLEGDNNFKSVEDIKTPIDRLEVLKQFNTIEDIKNIDIIDEEIAYINDNFKDLDLNYYDLLNSIRDTISIERINKLLDNDIIKKYQHYHDLAVFTMEDLEHSKILVDYFMALEDVLEEISKLDNIDDLYLYMYDDTKDNLIFYSALKNYVDVNK